MTTLADPTQIVRSGAEDGYPFRPAMPAYTAGVRAQKVLGTLTAQGF